MRLEELTNLTEELMKELNIGDGDRVFGCYNSSNIVGYAVIKKDLEDRLYLVITEEFQNQGYGSEAFKELLSIVKDTVRCMVPIENYKMQRIVSKNAGVETGRDGIYIHYIIKGNDKNE